jgi:hypothetical protein
MPNVPIDNSDDFDEIEDSPPETIFHGWAPRPDGHLPLVFEVRQVGVGTAANGDDEVPEWQIRHLQATNTYRSGQFVEIPAGKEMTLTGGPMDLGTKMAKADPEVGQALRIDYDALRGRMKHFKVVRYRKALTYEELGVDQ